MRPSFWDRKTLPLLFPLIAFLFLLVYSCSTSPIYAYQGFDSAIFKIIGQGITQGKLPYVDLFDHKGPLIFFADALGLWLIPGRWGIFLLQVLFLSVTLSLVFKTCCLITDRKGAFFSTLLLCIPMIDLIVEGNQCEEWCLPLISLCLYLSVRWTLERDKRLHPYWQSLVYGLCFALIFFVRPNDAVASVGSLMLGVFLLLLSRREYANAAINALVFLAGCAVGALPPIASFAFHGALDEMFFGTIFYNLAYAEGVSLRELGVGIIVIPMIVAGLLIFFGFRHKEYSRLNFLFIPYLLLTLLLIGKRDYYHYLIPLAPYIAILFSMCLKFRMKSVVAVICVLFLAGSGYQHRFIFRLVSEKKAMVQLYSQTDRLFECVPDTERNSVWNYNMHGMVERHPNIYSLIGVWTHSGYTPGNRIFVPFHVGNFGETATFEYNRPEWAMAYVPDGKADGFLGSDYDLVSRTDDNCVCTVALYRRNDGSSETVAE